MNVECFSVTCLLMVHWKPRVRNYQVVAATELERETGGAYGYDLLHDLACMPFLHVCIPHFPFPTDNLSRRKKECKKKCEVQPSAPAVGTSMHTHLF